MRDKQNLNPMNKADLDPWRVISSVLFEVDSYEIPKVIDQTGLAVNWALNEKENHSNSLRKAAYRPRINKAYEALSQEDRLRVAYIVVEVLVKKGLEAPLNEGLHKIGWEITSGRLTPSNADVKELFFPAQSQHDAYSMVKKIFRNANRSIIVVDPYLDSSIFSMLADKASSLSDLRLLTLKVPQDFSLEAKKFGQQYPNLVIKIRLSAQFHDRFIIVDSEECWHIGCSIKDAGHKAFMLSQIEDVGNSKALIDQTERSWSNAQPLS